MQGAAAGRVARPRSAAVRAQLSLDGAQLQGASLDGAQLQGASLDGAQLQGARLVETFVWRAVASRIDATDAYVDKPETGRKYRSLDCDRREPCDWSGSSYAALRRLIEDRVPAGDLRRQALTRITVLDPENKEEPAAAIWAELEEKRPAQAEYQKKLAEILGDIGCKSEGAPYVVRGLLPRLHGLDAPGGAGGGCLSERRSLPGRSRADGNGKSGVAGNARSRSANSGRTGATGQSRPIELALLAPKPAVGADLRP